MRKLSGLLNILSLVLIVMLAQACVSQDSADGLSSNPGTIVMDGTGGTPSQALLVSTLSSVSFGQVGMSDSASQTLIIMNAGVKSAQVGAITISLPAAFSVTSNACSATTLATGSSCNITIQYSPSATGVQAASFALAYQDDGSSRSLVVPMTGTGGVNPELTFSESPYNFGNVPVGNTRSHVFTVSNNTTAAASVGTSAISGANFSLAGQTCHFIILQPAATCTITVAFNAPSIASFPATLTVPFTNSLGIPFTKVVTLGGAGIASTTSFLFSGFTGNEASDTVGASKTSTGVTLKWTAQPAASYYKISRTGGGGPVVTSAIYPSTRDTYPISGLVPNTTYTFQINAYDGTDVSDGNTSTVSITTPNVAGATFNGWSDAVATGAVFTDIGDFDTAKGTTGANRLDRNLAVIAGFGSAQIDTTSNEITTTIDVATGQGFIYRTDGANAAPLVHGSTYYAIRISATAIKLATSLVNAKAGTAIDLTSAGTGNMTLMPQAVVKIGWDLFTILPSGVATSYNIYRNSGSGFALIGMSTTQSYVDYSVSGETNYFYKVQPLVSGAEVLAPPSTDSEIKIFVPAQNMSLLHRWIANREACTTLLGVNLSDINRGDDYSCPYTWGSGYAPNTLRSKLKWDLGNSLVFDRWKSGCKMKTMDTSVPTGGVDGDVHFKQPTNWDGVGAQCFVKDATLGWVVVDDIRLSDAIRKSALTNYPGYSDIGVSQDQAYGVCQQRSATGVTDGNLQSKLRLGQLHEFNMARAVQGVNVNKRNAAVLSYVFNSVNLPAHGSCNVGIHNGNVYGDGVLRSDPAIYSIFSSVDWIFSIMNGAALTRNCQSRYEISTLWDAVAEWTSTQYLASAAGNGRFIESFLNPKDNLLEDFVTDGFMSTANTYNSDFYDLFNAEQPTIPMFGVSTIANDAGLGSRTLNYSDFDYGNRTHHMRIIGIGQDGYSLHGVHTSGQNAEWASSARFAYGTHASVSSRSIWGIPISHRCVGEVNP